MVRVQADVEGHRAAGVRVHGNDVVVRPLLQDVVGPRGAGSRAKTASRPRGRKRRNMNSSLRWKLSGVLPFEDRGVAWMGVLDPRPIYRRKRPPGYRGSPA